MADQNNNSVQDLSRYIRNIPAIGIILAALSGLFFATASLIVKKISSINPIQILVSRSVIQVIFFLPIILYHKHSISGIAGERSALIWRGIVGAVFTGLMYSSYRYIPVADSSTIIFSAPVYTTILGCIFLDEDCSMLKVIGVIISISGGLLISKPSFIFDSGDRNEAISNFDTKSHIIGCTMAFCAAIGAAIFIILLRKLKQTPTAVVISTSSIIAIIFGMIYGTIIILCFSDTSLYSGIRLPISYSESLYLMANGICGIFGQLTLTLSLKLAEAGIVSLARTIEIVCAFIFQTLFLKNESVDWHSYLGASFVVIAVTISAVKKIMDAKK